MAVVSSFTVEGRLPVNGRSIDDVTLDEDAEVALRQMLRLLHLSILTLARSGASTLVPSQCFLANSSPGISDSMSV